MFLFLITKSFIPVFRVWWSAGGFELDWQSCKCSNYFTLKLACGEWAAFFIFFWKKHSGMFYKQQRLFEFKLISKLFMFSLGWPRGERVSERVHDKLDVQFVVPFVGSSAQTSFGFFWASFYVCVLWTACLTALWGSFMFECGLKCSSYAVVACFGANAVSKCPAWPLKPLLQ